MSEIEDLGGNMTRIKSLWLTVKNNKGSRMMVGISWSPCLVISCYDDRNPKVSTTDQLGVTGELFNST